MADEPSSADQEIEGLGSPDDTNDVKDEDIEGLGIIDDTKDVNDEATEHKESRWRDKVEAEESLGLDIPADDAPEEDAISPSGDSPAPDLSKPRKKVDPNKPKSKLKVTLVGASNLRPHYFPGPVTTSCSCEIIDPSVKKPRDGTKFETEVVEDTKHPTWKKEHTWDESDFTPGDHIKVSIKDVNAEEADAILGCAELPSKRFYPEGFEGPCELRTASGEKNENVGTHAHVKIKIEVEAPEDDIAERTANKKRLQFEKQKAQAQARIEEGNLSPWGERIAGLVQSTPRVAPGQVLKPKGTPRYERLYQESLLRQGRLEAKLEEAAKSLDKAAEEKLLPWHKKDGVVKTLSKEAADEVVTRLYADAESRRVKLDQKISAREEKLAATLLPLHPPTEHDDPNKVIQDSVAKLHGDCKVKLDKLDAKRKELLEKELETLIRESIHKVGEGKELDLEYFKGLHEDHAKKLQKIAARALDAEQQAIAITRVPLNLPSESILRNGVRLSILGAKGLLRPEHSLRPEPYVICQLRPGVEVRSRPVRWQNQVSWKEEVDLTELYDGKEPLLFAVYAVEPD
jgi:hypothetical protein